MIKIRRVLLLLVLLSGGLWTFTSSSGAEVCTEALSDCSDEAEGSPTPSPSPGIAAPQDVQPPDADDSIESAVDALSPQEDEPDATPTPTPRSSSQGASCGPNSAACGQVAAQQPTSTPTAEPTPAPTDDSLDDGEDDTKDDKSEQKDEDERTGVGGKGDLPTSGAPLQAYGATGLALLHLGGGLVLAERIARRRRRLRDLLTAPTALPAELARLAGRLRSAAVGVLDPVVAAVGLAATNAVKRAPGGRLVAALFVGSTLLAMALPTG